MACCCLWDLGRRCWLSWTSNEVEKDLMFGVSLPLRWAPAQALHLPLEPKRNDKAFDEQDHGDEDQSRGHVPFEPSVRIVRSLHGAAHGGRDLHATKARCERSNRSALATTINVTPMSATIAAHSEA